NERINCAMLAQSHPLAAFASLTPSQLRGEDLRLDTSLLLSARLLAPALERLGLGWREAHTLETAYGHVLAGNGWTPVPQSFRNSPPIDTTIVPLQGLDVEVPMTLRWRKDNDLPAVRNFAAIAAGAANGATRPNGSIKVPGAKICAVAEQKTTPFGADTRPAIELRQLRAALTTMQEGSISGAARRLHLTQPAVARQIHSLERELGTPLVHRGASGLVPTAAGEVFRAEARGVLTTVDDAVDRAKLLARGIVGRCLIGSPPAELTDGLLARTLRQLKVRHPELSVTIRLRAPVAGLAAHEIDVALHRVHGGVANEPNLCTVVLREDALDCALIASDHPRASREWLTPIELADMPLLSGSRASNPAFYDAVTRAIVPVGLARSQPGEYNSARIIFSMVAKGVGWTLVSRSIRGHTPAGTVVIPIEGVSIFWGLALSWRREELSPTVRIVIDSFRGVTGT
ncbi:MAG TPA: LysR substrate-binding domain-containing protein, partial [Gemmatimonadaceae bacterium]|nr:LysR substrate-binding domain-containing protein [Gemmatimonadaceae bacterium]